MEQKNKNWGGKRANAGRKRTTEKRVMFGASAEALEILSKVEGNKSDFINKAILAYKEKIYE